MRTAAAEFRMLDWKTSEGFFQALPRWVRDGTRRLDESASVRFVPRNEAEDREAEFHVDSAIAPLHVHEGDWVLLFDDGTRGTMSDSAHRALLGGGSL